MIDIIEKIDLLGYAMIHYDVLIDSKKKAAEVLDVILSGENYWAEFPEIKTYGGCSFP